MKATKENLRKLGRLQKRSDFLSVAAGGQKWIAKSMIVQRLPNPSQGVRFGVTVTKKLDKRAVGRNRMKRRLRAVASDVLTRLDAGQGFDYVLIARAECATKPYDDLVRDFEWCLKKLGASA